MRSRLILIISLLIGIVFLLYSGYIYFVSEKIIYTSENIEINNPSTSVTRTITIKEDENPHKINLNISYPSDSNNLSLFSYEAEISNQNHLIEKKSSSFNPVKSDTSPKNGGNVKESVDLFTLKDLPTGNYIFSLRLIPNPDKNQNINKNISYSVRSKNNNVNIFFITTGILLIIIPVILLKRSTGINITHETKGLSSKS